MEENKEKLEEEQTGEQTDKNQDEAMKPEAGNAPDGETDQEDRQQMQAQSGESMEDLLRQILEADKKEVRYAKMAAIFTFGLFVILLAAAIIIVPKVVTTLASVNNTLITVGKTIETANGTIEQANGAIDGINTMTSSITETSDNMNSMLTDNAEVLTDAVEKMNNIDFEGLNQAIQDLQDAVGPFATFMKKFN